MARRDQPAVKRRLEASAGGIDPQGAQALAQVGSPVLAPLAHDPLLRK